jgi:hypothetical protein
VLANHQAHADDQRRQETCDMYLEWHWLYKNSVQLGVTVSLTEAYSFLV